MVRTERYRSWATTHLGVVRKHNEDAYVNRPEIGLWAVADGAGGHARGDLASCMITQALDGMPAGLEMTEAVADLRARITIAHDTLRATAERAGPATLIASTVVILTARAGHFSCLWAGDSRAYRLRGGVLTRITRDHSLVQELVDSGTITAAEAETHPRANVITRAVGADEPTLELDRTVGTIAPGDRFLLCSDGLSKIFSDDALGELLGGRGASNPSQLLVDAALSHQARDNVTAVVVDVLPPA
jgi:protein phosphatase/serine/threonine-protein phosphatase Stp1